MNLKLEKSTQVLSCDVYEAISYRTVLVQNFNYQPNCHADSCNGKNTLLLPKMDSPQMKYIKYS